MIAKSRKDEGPTRILGTQKQFGMRNILTPIASGRVRLVSIIIIFAYTLAAGIQLVINLSIGLISWDIVSFGVPTVLGIIGFALLLKKRDYLGYAVVLYGMLAIIGLDPFFAIYDSKTLLLFLLNDVMIYLGLTLFAALFLGSMHAIISASICLVSLSMPIFLNGDPYLVSHVYFLMILYIVVQIIIISTEKILSGFIKEIKSESEGREQAIESLKDSLHEKDTLIHEIQHRVHNNLQVMNSLLSIQQRIVEGEKEKWILEDSIRRLDSISLAYSMVYDSRYETEVDLDKYLSTIILGTVQKIGIPINMVQMKVPCCKMNSESAIGLGMLLNELLSFIEVDTKEALLPQMIGIECEKIQDTIVFQINATKVGERAASSEAKKMRMLFIQTMIKSNDGIIEIDSNYMRLTLPEYAK